MSARALERGASQLGTLGSGNHFAEIQYVAEIYDDEAPATFGLRMDQVTVMVHSGSRGVPVVSVMVALSATWSVGHW